ncbi:BTAD domain-containing putative transcriptional regulator [Streptomyces sp. NRRL F-5650]|uniref:BTAD domain-containing putative transcriptional regulator n=1 Tax=Streptomyces sp. NRRL F-5650 TaxID=1463868 RepID=UPI0006922A6E|nr:BTAD domain-containing putative transcriptional regulator [Streptomyces sp. NRRL F-5650]
MEFLVLGPLRLMDGEKQIALGGDRRRATLGLLLLNANREVATSKLLEGLWGAAEAPATARKILQNAVRALRVTFAGHQRGDARPPALLTCTHGYQLQVDPEQVDMFRFHRRAQAGRAELAAGRPAAAAAALREALALWRGRPLADLVEAGHSWAELTALQNARLVAMEDYYEAQLANGRHHAVLGPLEALTEAEPLRERAVHQLMLALYRSGRQTDALAAYQRLRIRLAEQLGLEPGRELRQLQHALLVHDPSLAAPTGPGRQAPSYAPAPAPAPAPGTEAGPRAGGRTEPGHGRPVLRPVQMVRTSPDSDAGGERSSVSALLVRVGFGATGRYGDVGEALERTAAIVREQVERFDGVIAGSTGSVMLALFRSSAARHGEAGRAAERAMSAALALRERIPLDVPGGERLQWRMAVSTCEAPVPAGDAPRARPPVAGAQLVACESLLQIADDAQIVVCDRTRELTAATVRYAREVGFRPRWTAQGRVSVPFVRPEPHDRDPELGVLSSLLERVRRRSRPHLVVVQSAPGVGKSSLLAEFERRVENAVTVRLEPGAPMTARRVAQLAAHLPVVLFADDLHLADNAVLQMVEDLLDPPGPIPLLVVAAARPELFRRRPGWGAGQSHASRMTLDPVPPEPLSDTAQQHGLPSLCQAAG